VLRILQRCDLEVGCCLERSQFLHISTSFSATEAVHHLFCHARGEMTIASAVGNTPLYLNPGKSEDTIARMQVYDWEMQL